MSLLLIPALLLAVVVPFLNYLVRRDGPAIHAVSVEPQLFKTGDLPAVCCKTGAPAEVGVTVLQHKWFRTTAEGIIPITNEQHRTFHKWKRVNHWSRTTFLVAFLLSFPLQAAEFSAAFETSATIVMLLVALAVPVSNWVAQRALADPRRERDGSITLRGVHPAFVLAVQESRRTTRPATTADKP